MRCAHADFIPHFTFYYEDYSKPGTFGDFNFLDRIGDNIAAGVGFGGGLTIDANYTVVDGWYVTGGQVTGGRTIQPVSAPGAMTLIALGLVMLLVCPRRRL